VETLGLFRKARVSDSAHVSAPHDRKKDGKVHGYWCLVRSVRVGRRFIQQTVAHLGELDEKGRIKAALEEHLSKRCGEFAFQNEVLLYD
jgi:hypothetical protein